MPSAGAIAPPVITAMRKPIQGKPSNSIDSSTFIELDCESLGCKIFFTTDGSRPDPLHQSALARESTFTYKGPFNLKPGRRTLKAISVSSDGVKQSNVVTKTFNVEQSGVPASDDDFEAALSYRDENDYRPIKSRQGPHRTGSAAVRNDRNKKTRRISSTSSHGRSPQDAFGYPSDAEGYKYNVDEGVNPNNNVGLPEGPINPTNYSGTQINFWGVPPNSIPGWALGGSNGGFSTPYEMQLGAITTNVLKNLDQPRLSINDLRMLIQAETQRLTPRPPAIEYVTKEPEFKMESPGNGDWKGQLEHIYAHLVERCHADPYFRTAIGTPKLGRIIMAEFDEEDDEYLLTVSITKAGHSGQKPKQKPPKEEKPPPIKTKPPSPPPPKPVEKVPEKEPPKPKPKLNIGTVAKVASTIKPPPKKETKEEKLKKRDPFFETEEYHAEGTLKPWPTFSAEVDCEKLRKAMKGLGTDEKAIIDVMGYRNANQRMELVVMFKTMFGKDLVGEFESELSGNFLRCCKALCKAPDVYDAFEIKKAIKGLGTDEDALIEILCTRTNAQIKAITAAYKKEFGKDMEKDVVDDTSGNFKKLLVAQINANRDENPKFDRTAAQDDAQALIKAGESKWGTDESQFHMILCQRSFPHLRAVFDEYDKLSKKGGIEEAIKSEFSGDIKDGLLAVVGVIRDKPGYFARKMQKAMKGLGTDDEALVRITVSRAECDMVQIKEAFQRQFQKSLGEWLKDDTSGDYREILLALTGDRPPPQPSAEEEEAAAPAELEEVEEEHIEREGTLKPAASFDPKADCEQLRKAMKGLGTDEEAIIAVMASRSTDQRVEIVKTYKTMFGKDLIAELKSELSGNFSHVVTSLCKTPAERDADELRKAMKGVGTDEGCLIEILCTRSNDELKAITEQFQLRHGKKLEEAIISETSGNLKRLLVSLLQAHRPEGNTIDRRKARTDSAALHEAGEKKFGTDESRFNVILCSRSFPQLRATFDEYQKLTGKDITESISSEMSGDLKQGYLTIVGFLRNQAAECARILHTAMHGLGTNDLSLTRIVVSRCEIDMMQIKKEFEAAYKQPLGKYIADDTTGDYRRILLKLVDETQFIKK